MKNLKLTVAGLLLISGTTFAQIIAPAQQSTPGQIQTAPPVQVNSNQVKASGQTTRTVTQQTNTTVAGQVAADGQTPVVNSGNNVPVILDQVQPVTTTQESETVQQQSVPANTGSVPKVYTNTTDALPFRDRQPKPTGQISPSRNPSPVRSTRIP